jgi:hypothetical protein
LFAFFEKPQPSHAHFVFFFFPNLNVRVGQNDNRKCVGKRLSGSVGQRGQGKRSVGRARKVGSSSVVVLAEHLKVASSGQLDSPVVSGKGRQLVADVAGVVLLQVNGQRGAVLSDALTVGGAVLRVPRHVVGKEGGALAKGGGDGERLVEGRLHVVGAVGGAGRTRGGEKGAGRRRETNLQRRAEAGRVDVDCQIADGAAAARRLRGHRHEQSQCNQQLAKQNGRRRKKKKAFFFFFLKFQTLPLKKKKSPSCAPSAQMRVFEQNKQKQTFFFFFFKKKKKKFRRGQKRRHALRHTQTKEVCSADFKKKQLFQLFFFFFFFFVFCLALQRRENAWKSE